MALFQKKVCSVCGAELIFLESTPVEDGVICGHCADKAAEKALDYYIREKGHAPADGVNPLSEMTVSEISRLLSHLREEEAEEQHTVRPIGSSGAVILDVDRLPCGVTALVKIAHGAIHAGDCLICEAGDITVTRMRRGDASIPAALAGDEVVLELEGDGLPGLRTGAVLLKK